MYIHIYVSTHSSIYDHKYKGVSIQRVSYIFDKREIIYAGVVGVGPIHGSLTKGTRF